MKLAYRGLADNTVGEILESLLRVDLIILDELGCAPLDDTATQLLCRLVALMSNAAQWSRNRRQQIPRGHEVDSLTGLAKAIRALNAELESMRDD